MNANKVKILKTDLDQSINIPINMQWDFTGRDEAISEYETSILKQVIGTATDFEISRFSHNVFSNFDTAIDYEFYFYDNSQPITATTVGSWNLSYLNLGFTTEQIYYYSKPFTKSFFKLDLFDSDNEKTQQLYLSIILPARIKPRLPAPTIFIFFNVTQFSILLKICKY